MLESNKNYFCIHCIAKKQKNKKLFFNKKVFDIVDAKKSNYNKYSVIQKIGNIDFYYREIVINFFKLVFGLKENNYIVVVLEYLKKYIFTKER